MSKRWWGAVALCSALICVRVEAVDLTLSGQGTVEYDDNAFRSNDEGEEDVFFRFEPSARIHEDRGHDFRYFLEYTLPVEFAARSDDLDDIDHVVGARLVYHPNDRLEIYGADNFRYLRGSVFDVAQLTDTGLTEINEQRERVTLNRGDVGAVYKITPRLDGSVNAYHEFYDTDRDDRAQNWLVNGSADLTYLLRPRHHVSAGVSYTREEFEETENIVASRVNSYNVYAGWTWLFDDTTRFQIRIGPAYIDSQQDDPPQTLTIEQAVQFLEVPAGASLPAGYVDRNNTPLPAISNYEGGVLVAQLGTCPQVIDSLERLAPCGFATGGTAPSVLIDDTDPLADEIRGFGPANPLNPDARGEDDQSINFFADAVLTKDWTPNFHTGLRYTRRQDGASGLGGAVISDTVSLSNNWDFADRWNLSVRTDWSHRESVTEATSAFLVVEESPDPLGGQDYADALQLATVRDGAMGLATFRGNSTEIETMRYGVAARVTHLYSRRTSFWGQVTYNRQESDQGTLGDPSDFDNFLASVGVRYVFEPIKIW